MTLSAYLLAALLVWSPPKTHPNEEPSAWDARARDIAADIAEIANEPVEATRTPPWKTGLTVLGIGFQESNFDLVVEQGHCRPHTCDNGTAWSAWQIHTGRNGLTFEGLKYLEAESRPKVWLDVHFAEVIQPAQLIADRKTAARMALHMWRQAPRIFSTAKWVIEVRDTYAAKHPFE